MNSDTTREEMTTKFECETKKCDTVFGVIHGQTLVIALANDTTATVYRKFEARCDKCGKLNKWFADKN